MKYEDQRLYWPPSPWVNHSKVAIEIGKPLGKVLTVMGVIILVIAIITTFYIIIIFSSVMILIGVFLWYTSHFAANDNVDSWHFTLPYSKLLYERIGYDVDRMLNHNRYHYTLQFGTTLFSGVDRNSRYYTIYFHPYPHIGLKIALIHIVDTDGPDDYYFKLAISNISKQNLSYAHQMAKEVYNIMYRHQYWQWKSDFSLNISL